MGTARVVAAKLDLVFLVAAILLLGRAHYITYAEKHGTRTSRIIVWAATIAALLLWASRFI